MIQLRKRCWFDFANVLWIHNLLNTSMMRIYLSFYTFLLYLKNDTTSFHRLWLIQYSSGIWESARTIQDPGTWTSNFLISPLRKRLCMDLNFIFWHLLQFSRHWSQPIVGIVGKGRRAMENILRSHDRISRHHRRRDGNRYPCMWRHKENDILLGSKVMAPVVGARRSW